MATRLESLPVDFGQDGIPKDRILYDKVQQFCQEQFGKIVTLSRNLKTWAIVKTSDEGEGFEVIGLSAIAYAIDCHIFHVKPSETDCWDEPKRARDMLTARMTGFIQDNAGAGTEVFVYVDPGQERFWKSYLRLLKAKPGNRHIVRV